ncbi:hypothetical protein BDR26DRAFT_937792 [Obelidium mucronatum]|nr:hypothetical protein BDR26DRAFT_937792 [Obelidium mucronatum]
MFARIQLLICVILTITQTAYSAPTNICASIKHNAIACKSNTTFTICEGGFETNPQTCALDTVCCGEPGFGECVWSTDSLCKNTTLASTTTASSTVASTANVETATSQTHPASSITAATSTTRQSSSLSCDGVPEGKIICASDNSFSICSDGKPSAIQNCVDKTFCCGTWSSACVWKSDASCLDASQSV